jgi:hypothetical protein
LLSVGATERIVSGSGHRDRILVKAVRRTHIAPTKSRRHWHRGLGTAGQIHIGDAWTGETDNRAELIAWIARCGPGHGPDGDQDMQITFDAEGDPLIQPAQDWTVYVCDEWER